MAKNEEFKEKFKFDIPKNKKMCYNIKALEKMSP